MRRIRLLMGLALLAGTSLAGCTWLDKEVRPKPPPDEFRAPPEDDPRYGKPVEYPKEAMEEDSLMKKSASPLKAGGMPGMGGMGGMGGGAGARGPGGF